MCIKIQKDVVVFKIKLFLIQYKLLKQTSIRCNGSLIQKFLTLYLHEVTRNPTTCYSWITCFKFRFAWLFI